MFNRFITILLLALPVTLIAQTITGRVLSCKDESSIPFATLTFKSTERYMVTNEEGLFKIVLSPDQRKDTLLISQNGYEMASLPIANIIKENTQNFYLHLIENQIPLPEGLEFDGTALIKKALGEIGKNYITNAHSLFGYYKNELINNEDLVYTYGEGTLRSLKSGYDKNIKEIEGEGGKDAEIVILTDGYLHDFRSASYRYKTLQYIMPHLIQGSHMSVASDVLRHGEYFFSKKKLKSYEFELSHITLVQGEENYVVKFKPLYKESLYSGEITINTNDLAITSIRFTRKPNVDEQFLDRDNSMKLAGNVKYVEYLKRDGKYFLYKSILTNQFINLTSGEEIRNNLVYVTTSLELGKYVPRRNDYVVAVENSSIMYAPEFKDFRSDFGQILRTENISLSLRSEGLID